MMWNELQAGDRLCLNGPLDYQWGIAARERILNQDPDAEEIAEYAEHPPTDITIHMKNTEAEVCMTADEFIVLRLEEGGTYFVPAEYAGQLSIVRTGRAEPVQAVDPGRFLSILGEEVTA